MQTWLRNVLLISSAVIVWAAVLLSLLTYQHNIILNSEQMVQHTHEVVRTSKELEADTQRLISKQRGYIITGDESFIQEYNEEKADILATIVEMAALTEDNPEQKERLLTLQSDFIALTDVLDARIDAATEQGRFSTIDDATQVRALSNSIYSTLMTMQEREDALLAERRSIEEERKEHYGIMLYGGIIASIALILLLNAAMFRSNHRRVSAELESRAAHDRFALAMKSTSDGVFDWDLEHNSIYYSPRFKQMLGYRDDELDNTIETLNQLIHPDDFNGVWEYINQYLKSQLSEYSQIFRMKHRNGGYIWVNSRARAIFNKDGKAVRLIGAHTDITSIKEMEEKSKREKDDAVSANRAKSEFLANMSHEIRTPLNSIIGVSNILSKSKKLDEAQRHNLLRTLQNSSISLMDLINDILDFAKIESGELKIEEREFELAPLLEQIISIMSVKANEKGIAFKVDYNGLGYENHYGDELRLRQILLNLVGNAIKFTDKGSVTVTATHQGDYLQVEVQDTGIGISEEVQAKLFSKFEQGDSSVNRRYGGTGLGLAISQQLAHMMDGEITLSSTEGEGSTFTLSLPVRSSQTGEDEHFTPQPRKRKKAASNAKYKGKVLIAEDYEGNIVVIKFLLDNMGIDYDIANNGAEAVAMYKAQPYPLVLMDVQMPEVDGFEATRQIRSHEKEAGVEPCAIIAMTAHALAGDSERCINAGMNDYLSKPLMEADIKEKFDTHLFKSA